MSGAWKCKKCGKINMRFIGTCKCGEVKKDGIQMNEDKLPDEQEKKEEKRKWRCPECLKINDRDYCSCGYIKTVTDKYVEEDQPVVTNKSGAKKKIVRVAIIVAAIICLAIMVKSIFFKSKVVKNNCEIEMLSGMNSETFCSEFNKNINNYYVETTGKNPGFDITRYIIEPIYHYNEISGYMRTLYGAFVNNTDTVYITTIDDEIAEVSVDFEYDNNDMLTILAQSAIQTLSGLDLYECIQIRETIENGIEENTCVYNDGVLYGINSSTSMYDFKNDVSKKYLEELESSGDCKIIYWE